MIAVSVTPEAVSSAGARSILGILRQEPSYSEAPVGINRYGPWPQQTEALLIHQISVQKSMASSLTPIHHGKAEWVCSSGTVLPTAKTEAAPQVCHAVL